MSYKVELEVDHKVMKALEQHIVAKKLMGNFYGIVDEFLLLILTGWKKKRTRLHVEMLKESSKEGSKTKPRKKSSTGSKQTKGWMKAIKESNTNGRTKTKTS